MLQDALRIFDSAACIQMLLLAGCSILMCVPAVLVTLKAPKVPLV